MKISNRDSNRTRKPKVPNKDSECLSKRVTILTAFAAHKSLMEPQNRRRKFYRTITYLKHQVVKSCAFCDSGLRNVLGSNTISSVDMTTAEDVQKSTNSTDECNRNFTVTDESIIYAIRSFPNTSTGGPERLTPLHLKDLTNAATFNKLTI
ncbi:hypothetical protein GJ496_006468 [Pomphorhynchus laevis]|nr:hypothetical protein GJ496_006468 [Pomphorhynchus laevis]